MPGQARQDDSYGIYYGDCLLYTSAQCTVLIGVPLIFENLYAKIWKTAKKEKKDKLLKNAVKMGRTLKAVGIDAHKPVSYTHLETTNQERETTFTNMMKLALETVIA